jgi:hypothetical protein
LLRVDSRGRVGCAFASSRACSTSTLPVDTASPNAVYPSARV